MCVCVFVCVYMGRLRRELSFTSDSKTRVGRNRSKSLENVTPPTLGI